MQMMMSSKTLTEQQIYDYSLNFIRLTMRCVPRGGAVRVQPWVGRIGL
jgi:hypothetical protein